MTNDDDDGPAFSLPDPDHHPGDIAERLMLLPEHTHLREHEVSFGYLMRNEPKTKGGRTELGSVHVTKTMAQGGFKDLFMQLLETMLGYVPEFVMVVNAPWWEEATPREREALVYHELLHVKQAVDGYGAPRFDRDGLPVWALMGHDIEAFKAEVQRYGAWKGDIAEFFDATKHHI